MRGGSVEESQVHRENQCILQFSVELCRVVPWEEAERQETLQFSVELCEVRGAHDMRVVTFTYNSLLSYASTVPLSVSTVSSSTALQFSVELCLPRAAG